MPLLREDLLTPIAGDNPSGKNLYYDPLYDKIKEARFEEEDDGAQGDWAHSLKKADFKAVTKLAGDALAKQTKDLQLIAWLGEAAINQHKFAAVPEILRLFRETQEQFWDTCYPELDEGSAEFRATPQEWFSSRCDHMLRRIPITKNGLTYISYLVSKTVPSEEEAGSSDSKAAVRSEGITDGKPTPEEWREAFAGTSLQFYEDIEKSLNETLEEVQKLQEFCESKYGDYYPNLGKVRGVAEELQHVIHGFVLAKGGGQEPAEGEEAATEGEPIEDSSDEKSAAARPKVVAKVRMKLGEPASPEDAAANIAALADWLRRQDGNQVAPYLIVHALRWGELRTQGETPDYAFLVAPSSELRQNLKQLYGNGDYENLLHEVEAAAARPCGRAWLDLPRYACQAAEAMGYAYVAKSIITETRALLQDYPELPNWVFADDTPTANPDTKVWLQEVVLAGMVSATQEQTPSYEAYIPPPEPVASGEVADAGPSVFEMAIDLARNGEIAQALESLSQEANSARSGRQRFRSQLHVAQVFLAGGQAGMALPIVQDLVSQLESRALFDWEDPSFVADTLSSYIRAVDQTTKDEGERERAYGLLCRINPAAALQISRRR